MKPHRADAYCPACGGRCEDLATILAAPPGPPKSLGPIFTGPGQPSFKAARHGKRRPGA